MQHRTSQGTTTFEAQYDDAPHSNDLGALMMGRTPEVIGALKSLLTTRVPALARLRVFSDVPKDSAVRQRVWDGSVRRRKLREAARDFAEALKRLGSGDARLSAVQGQLRVVKLELLALEQRLRYETKEEARWELWRNEYDAFDSLTEQQIRQRCARADVSIWHHASLLQHYGCATDQSTRLSVRDRRRAVLTDAEQDELLAAGSQGSRRSGQAAARAAIPRARGARSDRKLIQLKLKLVGGTVRASIARRRQRYGASPKIAPAPVTLAKMRLRVQRNGSISISIGAVRRTGRPCSYAE